MAKFVCKVCGYIYEGEAAPAECPVCHAKSDMFQEVQGELVLAAEHEYGIYAKTVKDNKDISDEDKNFIFEQLKANFNGECSEVGMYLCMARIAHREGYPEIGLYWEKAAYEEAEHAAKFAEMLGEDLEPNMKATTKDNLKWRFHYLLLLFLLSPPSCGKMCCFPQSWTSSFLSGHYPPLRLPCR